MMTVAAGLSIGQIGKAIANNSGINSTSIEKILHTYPEINPEWLLMGKGDMLKSEKVADSVNLFALKSDSIHQTQKIPLYNIEASAGIVTLFANASQSEVVDYIQVPNLPKCDGAVAITGDSMYPLLKSGDIIIYKQIQDYSSNIFWGEMYLLSIDLDGDEMVTVKFIQKSNKGENYIKLVSQNQHHQDKDIHLSKLRALALIKASIRINTML
ncbi:peptidase S24 [Flavobacterium branchiophilum]|uniref:Peptidase S24 n=2 Tax=Flavobacterium branchiophilum TaxID=55197 RepID=A0A2H3K9R6_9FLAO|nr:peptidase S24 [Flavobacterium branchiophilum]